MEGLTLLVLLVKFSKIILVTFIFIENFANAQIYIKWSEGFLKVFKGFSPEFLEIIKVGGGVISVKERVLGKGLFTGICVINWSGDHVNKAFAAVFLRGF